MGAKSDNFCLFSAYFGVFSPDLLMEYGIFILTVDISAILKNIDIDIDMDRAILKKLIWIKGFGKILILKRLLWKILILIRRFWKISISIKYWIGENLAYQIRLHSMEPLAIASITFIWNNKQPYTQEYFQTKPSFSWFFYFKKNGIWYALKQNLLGRLFQSSLPCRQIFQILNIYILQHCHSQLQNLVLMTKHANSIYIYDPYCKYLPVRCSSFRRRLLYIHWLMMVDGCHH